MQTLATSIPPRQPHAEVNIATNSKEFEMNVADTSAALSSGCAAESPDAEMDTENSNGKPPLPNYNVEMVSVNEFVASDWNPNHMADEQLAAYGAEVSRTGTISKPIIARWVEGKRQIVDGEQSWRAAIIAGISEVPCVMLELDNFEAMRQTLIRNEHGDHDPLEEGLLCLQMMKERGLSRRKLANELPRGTKFGEATVRNKLKYVEALALRKGCAVAEVRNCYAHDDDDCRTITSWSLRQLEVYLELPEGFRDRWFDAGANLQLLHQTFFFYDPPESMSGKILLERLSNYRLLDLVDVKHWEASMQRLGVFALWGGDHLLVDNIDAYIRPVAELRLNVKLLDYLRYQANGSGELDVVFSPEEWARIVHEAAEQTKELNYLKVLISNAVKDLLAQRGMDADKALTHEEVSMLAELAEAPDYIQKATFLDIKERYQLYAARGYVADEVQEQAKEMVVAEFARRRNQSHEPPEFEGRTVTEVYRECARQVERDQSDAHEDEVLSDLDRVKAQLLERLGKDDAIRHGTIQGRPTKEVLAEQLTGLAPSLLTLLGSACLFPLSSVKPSTRWLQAAGGVVCWQSAASATTQQLPQEA